MAEGKNQKPDNFGGKFSGNRSIEDAIKAAVSNPERDSEYVQSEIIRAIKNKLGYEYSLHGQNITIIGLCELLPELTREEIVSALVDMKGINVNDSASGSIHFRAHFFE